MKKAHFTQAGTFLTKASILWWNRDPFSESAIIAYNAIFSLPGLLVVVMKIAGYFFGDDAMSGRLHRQITQSMGSNTADQIQSMVMLAVKSKDSVLASIIGILIILAGATGVFVQLQKSLNAIWEVKASTTKSGMWSFIKTRIFSYGLILSISFLLLVSLVISSLLSALSSWVSQYWSESLLVIFKILNVIFSIGIITVLFAMMFKYLPDAKIKWHSVWIGAFLTSLLFVLGNSALGLYFGKVDPGSGYGAAGSIVLILLWTSYSSMILFFGAEFTKIFSDYLYGQIPPTEIAVKDKSAAKP
ncbi:MAG: YihY/virulence factor BrkB family protein [Saprospiraceae bacterium]